MRRFLCSVVLAASATPLLLSSSGQAASGSGGVLIPARPGESLAGKTVLSQNWSGYVVRSSTHGITSEVATFKVPTASSPPAGHAFTWVGIGGFKSEDLIQAGVAEQTSTPHYFAWYEMLPQGAVRISGKSVSPGERVTVRIKQVSSGRWSISLNDADHWSWSKTFTYSSSRSTAEWIQEAPTVDGEQTSLPKLSTTMFGPTSTFVRGGTTNTIAQGSPIRVIMVTGSGGREATPSALGAAGQSFNDCAYTETCQTP